MEYLIRHAELSDLDEIYSIEKVCFDERDAFVEQVFHYFLIRPKMEIFLVATTNEEILGFIIVQPKSRIHYTIITIDVLPEWRRKGIGKQLMLEVEKEIISTNKRGIEVSKEVEIQIELVVFEQNTAAKILYEKLGYEKTRIIKNYYSKNRNGIEMIKKISFE
ncbi:MAG: GNAT family N-acetyltransferase [Candidatus Heimdallarchaeota archaeon]